MPNCGSSGIASAPHIAGDLANRETGAALVHVPYRGQGPALNDLLGGRLDVMFPLAADVFSFVKSGKLPAFAMMSERRAKALPDVPTTAELGLPKLRLSPIWTALCTVAGTPRRSSRGSAASSCASSRRPRSRRGWRSPATGARLDPGRARALRRRDRQVGRDIRTLDVHLE